MAEEKIVIKIKEKNLPQSALKLRLVTNMVRGMKANEAQEMLRFVNKKGALMVRKAVDAAAGAAQDRYDVGSDQLLISHISVDEAPTYKRVRFASRGRVSSLNKRRSHINLEVTLIK